MEALTADNAELAARAAAGEAAARRLGIARFLLADLTAGTDRTKVSTGFKRSQGKTPDRVVAAAVQVLSQDVADIKGTGLWYVHCLMAEG